MGTQTNSGFKLRNIITPQNILVLTWIGLCVVAVLFFLTGCKKDNSSDNPGPQGNTSTFYLRMTDAPGDYQEVNVDIVGAEVNSDSKGWVALNVKPGVYNLLRFSEGLDTLIASGDVPVGRISQIRLILGSNNTVKVDSQLYELKTPSAQQSGLKLQVNATIVKDTAYTMLIDFDADKSIVETGSGKYILKPVIRVITKTSDKGAIKGIVLPAISQPAVYAISGTDSFSTYASAVTGNFYIGGLAAGSYKVLIMPKSPYGDTSIASVAVNSGAITDVGTVTVK